MDDEAAEVVGERLQHRVVLGGRGDVGRALGDDDRLAAGGSGAAENAERAAGGLAGEHRAELVDHHEPLDSLAAHLGAAAIASASASVVIASASSGMSSTQVRQSTIAPARRAAGSCTARPSSRGVSTSRQEVPATTRSRAAPLAMSLSPDFEKTIAACSSTRRAISGGAPWALTRSRIAANFSVWAASSSSGIEAGQSPSTARASATTPRWMRSWSA